MAGQLLGSVLLLATPLVAIDFGYSSTGLGNPLRGEPGLLDELSDEQMFVQCFLSSATPGKLLLSRDTQQRSSGSFPPFLVLLLLEVLILASSSCW